MGKGTVNKVILVGNLGRDPEVRYTPDNRAIANITIATSDSWTDKNTGQAQERTEWHRVVMFNRLGEIAGQYLKKGSKVYIEGRLQTRKWTDQTGAERYTTEIVANEMQMLDSRPGTGSYDGSNDGGGYSAPQQASAARTPQPSRDQSQPPSGDYPPVFDDDIPF